MTIHGLDWLRMTAPADVAPAALQVVARWFGAECTDQRGFGFYASSKTFAGGARLLTDHTSGNSCMVELTGETLSLLEPGRCVELARELLEAGMRPTRCDIAIDVEGEDVRLVEAVEGSCEDGHLVGAKRWKPVRDYGVDGLVGHGVYLGVRGKDGSGRYVRCYAKDLEQRSKWDGDGRPDDDDRGSIRPNTWHRWEVEFTDECAEKILRGVVLAERWGSTWESEALRAALGSVDFREGDNHQCLNRRNRLAWWAEVIAGLELVRVRKSRRVAAVLTSKLAWLKRCVAPTLHAWAQASGRSVRAVASEVLDGAVRVDAVRRQLLTPSTAEFARARGPSNRGHLGFSLVPSLPPFMPVAGVVRPRSRPA